MHFISCTSVQAFRKRKNVTNLIVIHNARWNKCHFSFKCFYESTAEGCRMHFKSSTAEGCRIHFKSSTAAGGRMHFKSSTPVYAIRIRKKQTKNVTSNPKGNDRSPEFNVPRSKKKKKKKKKIHINGPWKQEVRNRTRPSFYACPGY